ncbi:ABC transporter A family protein [Heterostelium album PN500]|uniref:ABC transporter A family protein n=1 Tax=Heterostelium pallidum (strain ATCC 26659 / Pp 5 / PN500) TaxID=670386 RepID=D3BE51_HETP5|nr:ABC transporter A family protein [Heterostelium album PN500]EFA80182.1 ABC transporter A family protein [Heterostelium album PN500]|eukprot:XP_020432302.1 ABC transporter A family protein [Heterostelium album PN500]
MNAASSMESEPPKSNQFRATFLKSATFLKRQKCALILQICIPLVLVLLLCIIQIFVKHQMDQMKPTLIPAYNNSIIEIGHFLDTNPNGIPNIGTLGSDGNKTGLLGKIPQVYMTIPYINESMYVPYSQDYPSVKEMMQDISNQKTQLINQRRSSFLIKNRFEMPFSAIIFNQFSAQQQILDYQVAIDTQPIFEYGNISDPTIYLFTMNLLESAYIYYVYGQEFIINSNLTQLPFEQMPPTIDVGSLLGGLFYPFALSFLLPLFVFSIVLEKQERLRDMCLMMGLRMRNYWIVTYLFDFLLYICALIIVVGISVGFGFAVFTQGSAFAMFLLLFGWGNAMITFSFFLSTLFKRTRTATVSCYFLLIISVIVNLVLSAELWANSMPPVAYYFYPLFAFYRGLTNISTVCGVGLCPKWSDYTWDFEPSKIIFWLYIDSVFYLLLALYLDQVLPREFGVPKHPLFFTEPIVNWIKKRNQRKPINSDEVFLINENNDSADTSDETVDEDVAMEKIRIINKEINSNSPIIINSLTKIYAGRPKPALDKLYLTIENGECFGLLGPNGAGKTTTISLLTGLYTPTSGYAKVAGFDIATEMDSIHRVVGVCPQFDTLWEDLSCVETLLFYARLKGVERSQELKHVEDILRDVMLYDVRERLVKELSGGMKRRLSVAVSITGHSKIVFLDEPSTGLDPKTRRELWSILNRLKQGRCIILTTHSMEEADVLSTRIGIISQGKLQCIGPQQHLKSKFGEGYSLKINIHPSHVDDFQPTELIHKFSPDALLIESFSGSYVYRLPKETLISELCAFMLQSKDKYHITEWGIQQTSLEDVFLKIASTDETIN